MPILADIGYDERRHNREIAKIKKRKLLLTPAIIALAEAYQRMYDVDTAQINNGLCQDFAHDLISLFRNLRGLWGDELASKDEQIWHLFYDHYFVVHQGIYYDSECPEGTPDWRELPFYQRANIAAKEKHGRSKKA